MHQRPDIDKIYLYVKDPFESKYQWLINGREKVEIKTLKDPKSLIDYSQTTDDVCKNLEYFSPTKARRVSIVFDDLIADMESNKKIKSYSYQIVFKRNKTQNSPGFYITLLFHNAENCKTKYSALFYHENS